MGMDVMGMDASTERGSYFRNNVWWWRPLSGYIECVAPQIYAKCKHWGFNDGDGLGVADSVELAKILQAELDSGRCEKFEKDYQTDLESMDKEPCTICAGTGRRAEIPKTGAGGIHCNGCDGEGKVLPWATHYPFSAENVQEFVDFLKECGGFQIW